MFRLLLLLLITFSCLISPSSFAQNSKIEGVLENIDNSGSIQEGEIFKAKMTIIPLNAVIASEFSEALKKSLLMGYFKVLNVKSINFSINNSEVLEVYLTLVLVRQFSKQDFYIWSYKGLNIPFIFKNITSLKNTAKLKEFLVHEQFEEKYNIYKKYYIVSFVVFLVLFILFIIKSIKKRRGKLSIQERRNREYSKWSELFRSAGDRNDFEKLFIEENIWSQYISIDNESIEKFKYEMKNSMYQESWDQDLLERITHSVDICKKSIGKKWK